VDTRRQAVGHRVADHRVGHDLVARNHYFSCSQAAAAFA
jgi:hypothetical protein